MGRGNGRNLEANENITLMDLPKLSALPGPLLNEMTALGKLKSYDAGDQVLELGSDPQFIGIVMDGILKMQKHFPDGRLAVLGLLFRGDMFGHTFDVPLTFSLEAVTKARVILFRKTIFEELLRRSPQLQKLVVRNLMREIDQARDWMSVLAHHKVSGRLAGFFIVLCTRFGTADRHVTVQDDVIFLHIPVGRLDLSYMLGTRPESLSRALHALADDGLIEIIKSDLVAIKDIEGLMREAGKFDMDEADALHAIVQSFQQLSSRRAPA